MNKNLENELKNFIENKIKTLKEVDWNTFKVVATTQDLDRDGEIIMIKGWNLDNYLKNPVVLANHNYTIQSIVWKMTKFTVEDNAIIVEGIFTEDTEAWRIAKSLYNSWFLKTVSVWFGNEKRNNENWKIIEEAELREISFVPVPANPNALAVDKMAKAVELWFIKSNDDEIPFSQKSDANESESDTEKKDDEILILDEIRAARAEISEIKELLIENQKFFDTLANWKAFLSETNKNEDDNSQKVEENYKQFLQNLNKNISNSLFELKNK